MHITRFIDRDQREVLRRARETYGDTAQILVSTEELCELAAVCSKYPRYKTKEKAQEELRSKAVDEVADTLIVLDHIINIFGLTPVEIGDRITGKISRLDRWLHTSSSMEQTTIDRDVPGEESPKQDAGDIFLPCAKCKNRGDYNNLKPGGVCLKCVEESGSGFDPIEGE